MKMTRIGDDSKGGEYGLAAADRRLPQRYVDNIGLGWGRGLNQTWMLSNTMGRMEGGDGATNRHVGDQDNVLDGHLGIAANEHCGKAPVGGTDNNAVQSFSEVLRLSLVASNTFSSFLSIFRSAVAEYPAEQNSFNFIQQKVIQFSIF